MSNLLALLAGVVILWNTAITYYLYKMNRDMNRAINAIVLLNKCIGEIVEINDSLIKTITATTNRINELEKVSS